MRADPWQALAYLGHRLRCGVKALDGVESALAAFTVSAPSFEQAAVAKFMCAVLDQLPSRERTISPITRREIEEWNTFPF
jgi:hypothetical protein